MVKQVMNSDHGNSSAGHLEREIQSTFVCVKQAAQWLNYAENWRKLNWAPKAGKGTQAWAVETQDCNPLLLHAALLHALPQQKIKDRALSSLRLLPCACYLMLALGEVVKVSWWLYPAISQTCTADSTQNTAPPSHSRASWRLATSA